MEVSEAIDQRISVRAFKPDRPPAALVAEILQAAARSPSGGNLQPWRVFALAGEPLEALKAQTTANPAGETPEYAVYPADLWEPFRTRRFQCGEDLYRCIDIPRDDRPARLRQLSRNGQFFGAPVGLIFCLDRNLGPPQWADMGMYMMAVMLLAKARGLDTCPQEYWARYPKTLAALLDLPDELMVFAGMALGWRDEAHAINTLRTRRDPFELWGELRGFG
jgi:nitroreductase